MTSTHSPCLCSDGWDEEEYGWQDPMEAMMGQMGAMGDYGDEYGDDDTPPEGAEGEL